MKFLPALQILTLAASCQTILAAPDSFLLPANPEKHLTERAADPAVILDEAGKHPETYRVLEAGSLAGKKDEVITYYWQVGHKINIAFIGGSEADHEFVKKTAAPWFEHANLSTNYLPSAEEAEVRIKIVNHPDASYSYLGTTCLTSPKSEHTMQLHVPSEGRDQQDARVVLHEFGHMLGLVAENMNPNITESLEIDWEKLYTIAGESFGFDKRTVDLYYRPDPKLAYLYAGKTFDPDSVMMHPIPREAIRRGSIPEVFKAELSPLDKAFISRIYPKPTLALAESETIINTTASEPLKIALQKSAGAIAGLEAIKQNVELADTMTKPQDQPPGATSAKVEERSKQAMQAEEDIVREYMGFMNGSPATVREAATKFGMLYLVARDNARKENQNKAVYGLDDQYSPEVYANIYQNSKSVGSLMTTSNERLGTCFLVGKDLVLTCEHCLRKPGTIGDTYSAATLRVDFSGNANTLAERFKVAKVVFRGKVGTYEGMAHPLVDYVLLELGKSGADQLPSQTGMKPLDINVDPEISRDVAVYVIGYPGKSGNKTVADNARIFAGFSNNHETKVAYELQVYGEAELLQKEAAALDVDDETKAEAIKTARLQGNQLIEGFNNSFKTGTGNPPRWFLVSAMLSKKTPHPALALDSDTYHGNSGSPVFSRTSSDVIGVLFRGIDDRYRGVKPGWLRHEEAIPIHVILRNWKDTEPDGPARYGVIF